MARIVPRGLRGRLLAAFIVTSSLTLVVAATVLLGPLQNKLRTQSIDNLRETVLGVQPQFEAALRPKIPPPKANETEPLARAPVLHRIAELRKAAFELGQRIDVRVAVDADDADGANPPDFAYDSDFTPATPDVTLAALQAVREDQTVVRVEGDRVTVAVRLFNGPEGANGVLVAQRQLTEVTAAAEQVRNALLAAAAIGLLTAIVLGVMFSSTLLRRLARLRAVALRISA